MKLALLILNWNDATRSIRCLESVFAQSYSGFDTFLMDNGSEEKDRQALKSAIAQHNWKLDWIQYEENLQFTGAHLKFFESGWLKNYDYVCLLNNDAVAHPKWMEKMVDELRKGETDMIACHMLQLNDPSKIDSMGLFFLNTGEILPRGYGRPFDTYVSTAKQIGPAGGACAYSVKMLEKIEWFDPHFNTGYEDAEFALRSFLAGYDCKFLRSAIVEHEGSASIGKIRDMEYLLYVQKAIWYSYFKNLNGMYILLNLPFQLLKYLFVLLMYLLSFQWKMLGMHLRAFAWLIGGGLRQSMKSRKNSSFLRSIRASTFFLFFDIHRFLQLLNKR